MITNFKIFESINEPFKVGDYAIIPIRINNIVDLHIVKILKIIDYDEIKYKKDNDNTIYITYTRNIKYWSESKEELEIKLSSKKYNL